MAEVTIKSVDESDIDTILAEDIDFTGQSRFSPGYIEGECGSP